VSGTRLWPGDARDAATFVGPWMAGAVALTLLPMLASLLLSFTQWDGLSIDSIQWVGADNYRRMLSVERPYDVAPSDPWSWRVLAGRPGDPQFYKALCNSLAYSAMAVPATLAVGMVMALLLNLRVAGVGLFRTLYYMPTLLSGAATLLIWRWLFNPQFGPINEGLQLVYAAIDPLVRLCDPVGTGAWRTPDWLWSPQWCKPAVAIMDAWTGGGVMLVLLAALQTVPLEQLDAARVDGAGAAARFARVVLPQVAPAVLFCTVILFVWSMQDFVEAYLLADRSQEDGLLFYVLYLYECAFETPARIGYASALAWAFFVIVGGGTWLLLRLARPWVHYRGD